MTTVNQASIAINGTNYEYNPNAYTTHVVFGRYEYDYAEEQFFNLYLFSHTEEDDWGQLVTVYTVHEIFYFQHEPY